MVRGNTASVLATAATPRAPQRSNEEPSILATGDEGTCQPPPWSPPPSDTPSQNPASQTACEERPQDLQAEQEQTQERLETDRQERRRSERGGIFGPLIETAEKLASRDFEVPWGELFGARPKC